MQAGTARAGLVRIPAMYIPTLISSKREGDELSERDIRKLIEGYSCGDVPDYQMAAFAMAVFFKGMTTRETVALTRALMESGERFIHPAGHHTVVDKHSTGGIGYKVSLVLAPLVACAGCRVPMVSGRGLGTAGGTLDKLESIPGFNVHLTLDQAAALLDKTGVVIMARPDNYCPADRKLQALRDATGTVPAIPLIAASIMSVKLAESLDRLVLDVKHGGGAFMRTRKNAESLAAVMAAVGREMGVEVHTMLNPMDEPIGQAVGTALEVIEAVECLEGGGPPDLRALVLDLSEKTTGVPRATLESLLDDGSARRKFSELVAAQGGQPADLAQLGKLHRAHVVRDVLAPATGVVTSVDAGMIGHAALQLSAGRAGTGGDIDFAVGFDRLVKTGSTIHAGRPLCRIHARTAVDFDMAEAMLGMAVKISSH